MMKRRLYLPIRSSLRSAFRIWRAWGKAPGWYYQAVDRWGALAGESDPLPVTLMNGCRMLCDLTDHVERQIYFIGAYEPEVAFLLTRLLRPGMVMVDGGANVGQHSLIAAKAVYPCGVVYSFEPVPSTFDKLRRNVGINDLDNVQTEPAALWKECTTVSLGLAAAQAGNAGAFGIEAVDAISQVEAAATTLDSFVEALGGNVPPISLVKLDVEGAELPALQGMVATIERDRPSLLVEICRETTARLGYDVQAIWDLLVGGFGYDAWAVGTWTESTGSLHDLRNVEQQNVLFYDRRVVTIPVMPSDLKSLLSWVRGEWLTN